MSDNNTASQVPGPAGDPIELDHASLDDASGGAARIQTVKPTKKGGSVYADPEEGGE